MKEEQVRALLEDPSLDKISKFISEYEASNGNFLTELNFHFSIPGKPENYVRERHTSRGNRFYNRKGTKSNDIKKQTVISVREKYGSKYVELIRAVESEAIVDVSIDIMCYLKTQKASSVKTAVLKEMGILKPATIPDLDNYIKFYLDAFHGVFYHNDCCVTDIASRKRYSLDERVEFEVRVVYDRRLLDE